MSISRLFDLEPVEIHDRYTSFSTVGLKTYLHFVCNGFILGWILTTAIHRQLSQWRVVTALGQFLAVPHQKFLSWLKRFDCVEVDVQTVLVGYQVLLLDGTSGVDVTHPVAPLLVQAVEDMV